MAQTGLEFTEVAREEAMRRAPLQQGCPLQWRSLAVSMGNICFAIYSSGEAAALRVVRLRSDLRLRPSSCTACESGPYCAMTCRNEFDFNFARPVA